jgi:hypothetical protein
MSENAQAGDELMALLTGPIEELRDELKPYLVQSEAGFMILDHPILQNVMHFPQMNALMNRAYEQRMGSLREAMALGEVRRVIWRHEKPWRLKAFLDVAHMIHRDVRYWQILRAIWSESENIHQNLTSWRHLWDDSRPGRAHAMDRDERRKLAEMPDQITVYRGANCPDYVRTGMSWTWERPLAEWFASRYLYGERTTPYIAKGVIARDKVLALIDVGESEIVLNPDDLEAIEVERVRTRVNRPR